MAGDNRAIHSHYRLSFLLPQHSLRHTECFIAGLAENSSDLIFDAVREEEDFIDCLSQFSDGLAHDDGNILRSGAGDSPFQRLKLVPERASLICDLRPERPEFAFNLPQPARLVGNLRPEFAFNLPQPARLVGNLRLESNFEFTQSFFQARDTFCDRISSVPISITTASDRYDSHGHGGQGPPAHLHLSVLRVG